MDFMEGSAMGQDSKECSLSAKKCIPCQGGVEPLKGQSLKDYTQQLAAGWSVIEEHHLEKQFKFKNFRQALDFTNKVGELAESEGHHPDIYLAWGKVRVTLWTHKTGGLHENDFIMAVKIDGLNEV
jgi:4a-hydroxytetrahydrobiopterin dehydratase